MFAVVEYWPLNRGEKTIYTKHVTAKRWPRSLNRGGRWKEVSNTAYYWLINLDFGKWPLNGGWPLNRGPTVSKKRTPEHIVSEHIDGWKCKETLLAQTRGCLRNDHDNAKDKSRHSRHIWSTFFRHTLLFCEERQRNVSRSKAHVHSHCTRYYCLLELPKTEWTEWTECKT